MTEKVEALDAGYDLNVLEKTGKYAVVSPLNAPVANQSYLIDVGSANVGGISIAWQNAIDVATNRIATRTRKGGTWTAWNSGRERLLAARTYYVNPTTGADTNNGLTATTAFATIAGALAFLRANVDQAGYTVTFQLSDGNHAGITEFWSGPNSGVIKFQGNSADRTAVKIRPGTNTLWCMFMAWGQAGVVVYDDLTFDLNGTAIAPIYARGLINIETYDIAFMGNASSNAAQCLVQCVLGAVVSFYAAAQLTPGTNWRRIARASTNSEFNIYASPTTLSEFSTSDEFFLASSGARMVIDASAGAGTWTGRRAYVLTGGRITGNGNLAGYGSTEPLVESEGFIATADYKDRAPAPSVTVAQLSSRSPVAGKTLYVSDAAGGAIIAMGDGTNWRRLDTRDIVS